jgi:diketogulonate reductase-like aldo/keto reductase
MIGVLHLILAAHLLHHAWCCYTLTVSSASLGDLELSLHNLKPLNGHPAFCDSNRKRFLYFMPFSEHSIGRWILSNELNSSSADAYVDSFAPSPHLIRTITQSTKWHVAAVDGQWQVEELRIECAGEDHTIHLQSAFAPAKLSGFFMQTGWTTKNRNVFVQPALASIEGEALYLWFYKGARWMVGDRKDVGSDRCVAYVDASDDYPKHTHHNQKWHHGPRWERYTVKITSANTTHDVFAVMLDRRNGVKNQGEHAITDSRTREGTLAHTLPSFMLTNGVRIPMIGLGTGGLSPNETTQSVTDALAAGYTLLDTASSYDNEGRIRDAIRDAQSAAVAVEGQEAVDASDIRDGIFLTSKLWPTDLGFNEALASFQRSLQQLNSSYLDAYLIHWPQCYPHFPASIMDCSPDKVKNPSGTWQQSYRALEKLYSEGMVLSIGVSNFDLRLLQRLEGVAHIGPHVLQNQLDPVMYRTKEGRREQQLLQHCKGKGIFYQAYSSHRTLSRPSAEYTQEVKRTSEALRAVATKHFASEASNYRRWKRAKVQVLLRWLTQKGVGVLPRSRDKSHIVQNLVGVFDWELDPEDIDAIDQGEASLLSAKTELR